MIIAVDFDGTLTKFNEYPGIGEESPHAFEVLKELTSHGHHIVLNTMRSGISLNDAVRWIEDRGIKLYGVNNTPGQSRWTKSPKVYAHIYIDDAALGIPTTTEGWLDWLAIRDILIDKRFIKR